MKSRRWLKRTLWAGAFLAVLAALGGCQMLREFGDVPSAEETAAYEKLPYFKDGEFQSPEPLEYHFDRATGPGYASRWRFVLPNPNAPKAELPKVKLDASAFAATPSSELVAYWLGHSSLIIEMEGKRLLVDPVFGNAFPLPGVVRRFTAAPLERAALPPLDLVLITHDHYDHLEYATVRALRGRDVRFVVPLGVGAHLRKWGVPAERVHELAWGESFELDGLVVAAERTIHYSGRSLSTRNRSLWASYALKGRQHRVFVSGDSGYGEHFRDIGARHGPFDLAFIEIDGWNPGWPKTHMFPEEVIRAYRDVRARALVPVHWGVFDLARHRWDESIRLIADLAARAGDVRLLTPRMGEKLVPGESATQAWWETVGEE
ncbi:MAG: MBL fold metallo-hydrolase [Azoarcus sp.]|jgi:L-ascorbate metabolism protein UlaG (beta-lactamase superfamily)|nr:MBL fold metallo-hydrolase [Azoarcus sp.]